MLLSFLFSLLLFYFAFSLSTMTTTKRLSSGRRRSVRIQSVQRLPNISKRENKSDSLRRRSTINQDDPSVPAVAKRSITDFVPMSASLRPRQKTRTSDEQGGDRLHPSSLTKYRPGTVVSTETGTSNEEAKGVEQVLTPNPDPLNGVDDLSNQWQP